MAIKSTLTLCGKQYDVTAYQQNLHLRTQFKGYPASSLYGGGEITALINTPADTHILELMVNSIHTPTISGVLETFDEHADLPMRRIQFNRAYITLFDETFNTDIADYESSMRTIVRITPIEMTINKSIRVVRNAYWEWQKVEDDEIMPVKTVADPEVRLYDAYWLKPDGTKSIVFPIDKKVKVYLVLDNFEQAKGRNLEFEFEEETEDGIYFATCSGQVPQDGVIIVEDFEFKKKE